jgi:predicted nucleic acid-binding protein
VNPTASGSVFRPRRLWAVADASVWVSRFVPGDVNHVASCDWLYRFLRERNTVVAPTLLLVAVAGAIARRTGDPGTAAAAVRRLRRLPRLRWIGLTLELSDHAADLVATLRLRGADAVYVAIADRLNIPLFTWDAEQLTRACGRIPARTP